MDWIAMIFTLIGVFFNIQKSLWCWPIWIVANIFWIIYWISLWQIPALIVIIVYTIANIYGWIVWKNDKNKKVTNEI